MFVCVDDVNLWNLWSRRRIKQLDLNSLVYGIIQSNYPHITRMIQLKQGWPSRRGRLTPKNYMYYDKYTLVSAVSNITKRDRNAALRKQQSFS